MGKQRQINSSSLAEDSKTVVTSLLIRQLRTKDFVRQAPFLANRE